MARKTLIGDRSEFFKRSVLAWEAIRLNREYRHDWMTYLSWRQSPAPKNLSQIEIFNAWAKKITFHKWGLCEMRDPAQEITSEADNPFKDRWSPISVFNSYPYFAVTTALRKTPKSIKVFAGMTDNKKTSVPEEVFWIYRHAPRQEIRVQIHDLVRRSSILKTKPFKGFRVLGKLYKEFLIVKVVGSAFLPLILERINRLLLSKIKAKPLWRIRNTAEAMKIYEDRTYNGIQYSDMIRSKYGDKALSRSRRAYMEGRQSPELRRFRRLFMHAKKLVIAKGRPLLPDIFQYDWKKLHPSKPPILSKSSLA